MATSDVRAATYRLQLRSGFGFDEARAVVPYLARLGVDTLYLSPILVARAGSTHGYDVVDPTRIDPVLGGDEGFARLAAEARAHGLSILLDVVPNHLAASVENPWWYDVLERGPSSEHARVFDVDWDAGEPDLVGRVLLPVLGEPLDAVLVRGELALAADERGLAVRYHELRLPLRHATYALVVGDELARELEADKGGDPARALVSLAARDLRFRERLSDRVAGFAGRPGDRASFEGLARVCAQQFWQLASWKEAGARVNYRRFFDVNDLVGTRVETAAVFDALHARTLALLRAGEIAALRIDHVDGLREPEAYLRRLRRRIGDSPDVYVEKILVGAETSRASWPISGTTGYDFLVELESLFVDPSGWSALESAWRRATGEHARADDLAWELKRATIERDFGADLRRLARLFVEVADGDPRTGAIDVDTCARVLRDVAASFPVYRTYRDGGPLEAQDRAVVLRVLREARRRAPELPAGALGLLRRILFGEIERWRPAAHEKAVELVLRFQQWTGPVMAKGYEDTFLYVWTPLVSACEVGGEPAREPRGVRAFHKAMRARALAAPGSLLATTTHDTKRAEDARARISLLSEVEREWIDAFARWSEMNAVHASDADGARLVDAGTEWSLYQNLYGAWPLAGGAGDELRARIEAFALKAAREAKQRTSWREPDLAYEKSLTKFVAAILDRERSAAFLEDFDEFARGLALAGAVGGLARVVLKIAAPGVPDLYQGSEVWNQSLVDPDNRRPVDFAHLAGALDSLERERGATDRSAFLEALRASWHDGRIKLEVTARALAFRRASRALFARGEYLPLVVEGVAGDEVCAFARRLGDEWALALVPVRPARCVRRMRAAAWPIGERAWNDARLVLPAAAPRTWTDALGAAVIELGPGRKRRLTLARAFAELPVALLASGRRTR